jgi:D-aminopeptidase
MSMVSGDFEAAIDRVVARFDRSDGPGLAIGVLEGGEVRFRKGYGLADVGRGAPNGPDVPMRIASLSKQFLCTVVTMLEREGALSTEDDIRTHLPMLPDYRRPITLADLMANQSGIRDFLELRLLSGGSFAVPATAESNLDLVRSVAELNFAPGSNFAYCNTGFLLLTLVVEAIEKRPLEDVFEARIFAPLGMGSTRLVRSDDPPIPGRALPYVETPAGLSLGLWGVPLDGAGGVVSTVDDLMIWAKNLREAKIGSAELFAGMTSARPFSDGTPSIYGRGFSVLRYRGQPTFGHHGQLPGLFAEIAVFPELDTTIALIANTSALNPFVIGRRIADAILADRLEPKPSDPTGPAITGIYRDEERDALLEIASSPEGGMIATTVMTDAPLVLHAPGRFGLMWPMSMLDLALEPDGALGGTDGPRRVRLRRAPPFDAASAEADAPGRFLQAELRTVWAIDAVDGGLRFRIDGPCGKQDFDLHPIASELFQARMREEPCGPYRPVLRLSGQHGRRRLTITTDRTFVLSADEIGRGGRPGD